MIRRPPRSTPLYSSAASDVYKRQGLAPSPPPEPLRRTSWTVSAYLRTSWPSQRLKLSSPLRYDAQVLLTDTSLNVVANVSSTAGVKTVASTLVWAYCTPSLVKACTRLTRLPAEVVAAGPVGDVPVEGAVVVGSAVPGAAVVPVAGVPMLVPLAAAGAT